LLPRKVELGRVVISRNAFETLCQESVVHALARHMAGDWGSVTAEDWLANDLALLEGERLLSSYEDTLGTEFWIITERDRSATTILLPKDY
jgi:hypothetical protein